MSTFFESPAPTCSYQCVQCGKSFTSDDGGSLIVAPACERALAFCSDCGLPIGITVGLSAGPVEVIELKR